MLLLVMSSSLLLSYQQFKEGKIIIGLAIKYLIGGVILAEVVYAFGVFIIFFFGREISPWYSLIGQVMVVIAPLVLYLRSLKGN